MTDFVRTVPADASQAFPDCLRATLQGAETYAAKATEMVQPAPDAGADRPAGHPYHTQLS